MPDPFTPPPRFYSVIPLAYRPKEAAKALGICERHLATLTKRGEIPFVKAGSCTLYPVESLREWLASKTMKGGPTP